MIKVRLPKLASSGLKDLFEFEGVTSFPELFKKLEAEAGTEVVTSLKKCLILINGVNSLHLKNKPKLQDGDSVIFLTFAGGG